MPKIRVRDRQTGRVDSIDWNDPTRPPTRAEILQIISQNEGTRPDNPGSYRPPPRTMATPNAGQPSTFNKITGTMWGTDDSVLPPVPGVTRPLLPEIPEDRGTAFDRYMYNNVFRPSSSVVGAASDWATGKVAGAIVKPIARPIISKARSMFGAGAKVLPPVAEAIPKRVPLQLAERAESSGGRFLGAESGPPIDVTRPMSTPELKTRFAGPDPRKIPRASGVTDPTTGRLKPLRGDKGVFTKRPDESALPVTVRRSELPFVDVPPEIQAAYPEVKASRAGASERLAGGGRTPSAQSRLSPTDASARGGPVSREYTGIPKARRLGESRAEYLARTSKNDPVSRAASALEKEAETNANPKVRAASETLKELRQNTTGGMAANAGDSSFFGRLKNTMVSERGSVSIKPPGVTPPGQKPPITLMKPSLFTKGGRGRIKEEAIDTLNVPRAVMASVDLSAPLRQGATMVHKKEFYKALPTMIKSMASEDVYKSVQANIMSRPNAARYKEARLALTDMAGASSREELFMSKAAEHIPILGKLVRASGRGYVAFLNQLRADSFDTLVSAAKKAGAKTDDKAISKFINNATGRGDLGDFERYAPALNAAMFSPRLMASRVNMLNPMTYVKADPFVRKEYLKSMAAFGTAASTVLGLAKANGAEVELDPRSSDFAKIKIGKVRLDIGAGFQQYIRTGAQIVSNQRKDLESGRVEELGKTFKSKTRADVIAEFAESKASPIASFLITWAKNRTFTGEKPQYLPDVGEMTDLKSAAKELGKAEVTRRLTPMIAQDLIELYEEDPELMWMAVPATFGSSIQVHKRRSVRRPQ
jgi:hypothetical protein